MRRTVVAATGAALAAVTALANSASADPVKSVYTPGYSYGYSVPDVSCTASPAASQCAANGQASGNLGTIQSDSIIDRPNAADAAAGSEHAQRETWVGQSFRLPRPVHQIVATLHFSNVSGTASASSADGTVAAWSSIAAGITDSACSTYGCGAALATQVSYIAGQRVRMGLDTTPTTAVAFNPAPEQVLTVTLSMPDGSLIPNGRIFVDGIAFAQSFEDAGSCTTPTTDVCGTQPHSGTAKATASASLTEIDVSVS
jgi:hypothetical protein